MPITDPWLPPGTDSLPTTLPGTTFTVYRIATQNSGDTEEGSLHLDNVLFLWCDQHMGDDPGTAAFSYIFGTNDSSAPQRFEQALSTGTAYPKTVNPGDKIQVNATRPDGVIIGVFCGYVLDFGLALDGDMERVDFYAVGVAKTLWDTPIDGQYMRDGSNPTTGNGTQTSIVAQFNPRINGITYGNATPEGGDREVGSGTTGVSGQDAKDFLAGAQSASYPVFLDPHLPATVNDEPGPRSWTLEMAARYLVWHHNPEEELVENPAADYLTELLVAREPIPGVPFDPSDPGTYSAKDVYATAKPITGRAWPQVLHEMLRDAGFGMCFRTETNEDNSTQCVLDAFVLQDGPLKDLWLQPAGTGVDPRYWNLASAHINRDMKQVVNQWTVNGSLVRYEVSVILAPMFPMLASDSESPSAIENYSKGNSLYQTGSRDAYRLYGVDECGEGSYQLGVLDPITGTAFDFAKIFGTKEYAIRRRPARGDLISVDNSGLPYRAQLAYSTNYSGKYPAVWDGSGAWTPITSGWASCHDRLGIRVTCENPNSWNVGAETSSGAPTILKGVECPSNHTITPQFYLRYTCVIESDVVLSATAAPTGSSPIVDVITRTVDARDRLLQEIITANSLYNSTGTAVVSHDDTDLANAEATMMQAATECGVLAGHISIPYVTTYYEIGDRIQQINGRGLGFRTDGGNPGDTPVYPIVEGRRITNYPTQGTILTISDESESRHRLERKIRR